jgi:hypothetical protein
LPEFTDNHDVLIGRWRLLPRRSLASPAITMTVHAHLLQQSDAKAAAAINAALAAGKIS